MGLSFGTEFDDPQTQGILAMGLGLLGSRGTFAQSLAQGGQQGLLGYQQATQQKMQREQANLQRRMSELQLTQAQQAQVRQQAMQDLAQRSVRTPEQMAMQAGAAKGAAGPTRAAAAAATGMSPGFDWAGYANGLAGIDPQASLAMQASMRKEQPKLKDVQVMTDPGTGKPLNVFVFEDGTTKVAPYGTKPDMVLQSLGNRVMAIDKNNTPSGASFQMGASPDAVLGSNTQYGVAGITDKRERDLAGTRVQYIDMSDGSKRAMPTQIVGPQSKVQGIPVDMDSQKTLGAKSGLQLIAEARKLLPDATSSYVGAGLDQLGNVIGVSNEGADAAARLKILGGALTMSVPRFEGPQSNTDTAFYKEMAGRVADSTLPVRQRLAALDTMEQMYLKTLNGGSAANAQQPPWAPSSGPGGGPVLRFDAQGNPLLPGGR